MKRLSAALAAWALLFLATPGLLSSSGSALLAFLGTAVWARACSRPARRAFLQEWLAAGIGSAALCAWSWYVWPGTLLFLALVPGLYWAGAGALLRLLARRFPLALAAPAAWVGIETLKHLVEPPLGFGWMRLGTHLHDVAWLAGSARVWGSGGLSFAVAAAAGGAADLLAGRGTKPVVALGLAPLALAALLTLATSPPATADGPRVLLVQPSFEQARKMNPRDFRELFEESAALTERGLREAREAREPEVDLVAWGETMFPCPLAAPGLLEAWDRGARPIPWARDRLSRDSILVMDAIEKDWVAGRLFSGLLPPGASFLTGVEDYAAEGSVVRRRNAVLLWDAEGRRAGLGGKSHLVPGAEQLCGLERLAFVRGAVESVAGYVPDLLAFEKTAVLDLRVRDGRRFRFGVSVCFDNVYDDPYTGPLREGDLDFHLVCSNEAWYRRSFEYDQMVAFSRLLAIETGRSFVRATNAGITLVLDPAGREVARLERGGEDRMVAGTLRATVPVPIEPGSRTLFVRLERLWLGLLLLLPALLAWMAARPVTAAVGGARARA